MLAGQMNAAQKSSCNARDIVAVLGQKPTFIKLSSQYH